MAEASEEEEDPAESSTTTEASAEESEETTRPGERLRRRFPLCLQAQGTDNDVGIVGRVGQTHGLSNNDKGIRRGRGIDDAPEGSDKTTEAAGVRRRPLEIYNDNRGDGRGR